MKKVLFQPGLVLFLVGMLTGFVYSAYANWLAALLAAAWGAVRKLAPIAAAGQEASAVKEAFVSFPLVSLSLSVVVGVGILIVGLLTTNCRLGGGA